ncbi:hypothetical protein MKZ38_005219 [Zalerion maritima]|uniref:Transcription factor domain-containing protein n=1 Tax=Zalerion maritima TaxID=339359 RepID=A0AAD5WPE8_9PEZI|nr:hypothetical protein MKZ38_005219 [Zalerion maritima]
MVRPRSIISLYRIDKTQQNRNFRSSPKLSKCSITKIIQVLNIKNNSNNSIAIVRNYPQDQEVQEIPEAVAEVLTFQQLRAPGKDSLLGVQGEKDKMRQPAPSLRLLLSHGWGVGSLVILARISELETSLTGLIRQQPPSIAASPPTAVFATAAATASTPDRQSTTSAQTPGSTTPTTTGVSGGFQHFGRTATASVGEDADGDRPPPERAVAEASEMSVERMLGWDVFSQLLPLAGQQNPPYPPLVSMLSSSRGVAAIGGRSTPFIESGEDNLDVSSDTILQLVNNFLTNNHTKNPVLNVEYLWADVQQFLDHGLGWNGRSCLVLIICAISVLAAPFGQENGPEFSKNIDRIVLAESYFLASQRRMGLVYHETTPLSVQCTFLTAVYLMTTHRILSAWKCFSQAGIQMLGWLLSRNQETETPYNKSIAESLYWSCLKSELELRTELGLPGSGLNEMNYPNLYPTPPSPGSVEMAGSGSGRNAAIEIFQRQNLEAGWFFYLAEIALRRTMNDALSCRYHPGSWYYTPRWWTESSEQRFSDYVHEFSTKLETWYRTLPSSISFSLDSSEPVGDVLRGILKGHVGDIQEVVYFPAAKALILEDNLGPLTLQVARDALLNDVKRIEMCKEGFCHRHQGTWLMIRSCSRSAIRLLAVACKAKQVPSIWDIMPLGWVDRVRSVLLLIDYWQDESSDLPQLRARMVELLSFAVSST